LRPVFSKAPWRPRAASRAWPGARPAIRRAAGSCGRGLQMVQLTTIPSKQSMMGERYTLPAGIWNSVISRPRRFPWQLSQRRFSARAAL
jgi:hypothetical protein